MALTEVNSKGIKDADIATGDIADDAVTLAKMAAGTDGQIITYDASGNPTAVGPGTDGQVLTSTGAGSPPAFETLPTSGATLSGSTNNTVVTVTGANAMVGEANLTFDGTKILDISSAQGGYYQGTDTDGGVGLLEMGNGNAALQADTGNAIADSLIHFYVDGSEKVRIQADGDLKINDGDLVIGTSGHGIDFSAHGQAGGMTQELLDDYEEGTFTADLIHQGSSSNTGHYVKIGRLVIANFRLTGLTATGNNNHQAVGGLPFTIKNVTSAGGVARGYQTYDVAIYDVSPNGTAAYMYTSTGSNINAVSLGGKILTGTIIYITDS